MFRFRTNIGAASLGWLKNGAVAALIALSSGVSYSHAMAATTTEVQSASSAQALKYCEGGTQKGVAYFNGSGAYVQYVDRRCSQSDTKRTIINALVVSGGTVFECKLATAEQAIKLCHHHGIGEWDIAYIRGPAITAIFGPGYGCTTGTTTPGIGAAICR